MRKSLKLGAAVAGLALAGTAFAGAGTANANLADCRSGNFCAWSDDGFSGRLVQWTGGSHYWSTMHDDAESVYNNGKPAVLDAVNVYMDADYGRLDICVSRGETFDAGMNDNDYDSHKWVTGC
jgi:hypothetical protein